VADISPLTVDEAGGAATMRAVLLAEPDIDVVLGADLASPIFAYAMGQHAADWLEGKSVPQAMDILPRALTLQNAAEHCPLRGRRRRSRVHLQGSGASCVVFAPIFATTDNFVCHH
jgi:hypothetical protein